jgi:Tfp pilus assembly protein PilX
MLFYRVLHEEDGVGLVVAASVLMVTTLLAGVALSSAGHFTRSSVEDSRSKEALAAAQAGLDVALNRLVAVSQSPSANFQSRCVTTQEATWNSAAPANTAHCGATSGQLGNGASYTYYVSPSLDSSLDATLTGHSQVRTDCNGAASGNQRCLTAIGTSGGVSRRIQVRAAGDTLFMVGGMVGLKAATADSDSNWQGNNFVFNSDIGSNGQSPSAPIAFGNNTSSNPGAGYSCFTPNGNSVCGSPYDQQLTLSAPSPDTLPFAGSRNTNNNATASVGYTALGRILDIPANNTLVLAAGTYNFCSVRLNNGAQLKAAPGANVKIFVDSAQRDTVSGVSGISGCSGISYPSGMTQGNFNAGVQGGGVSTILDGQTGQLEIYLYGTATPAPAGTAPPPSGGSISTAGDGSRRASACGDDFDWRNDTGTPAQNVYVFGPNSDIMITARSTIQGAVTGCTATFWGIAQGAGFSATPSSARPFGKIGALPGSWRECQAAFAGNPESAGCTG